MCQTRVAIGQKRLFAKSKWQTRVISYFSHWPYAARTAR